MLNRFLTFERGDSKSFIDATKKVAKKSRNWQAKGKGIIRKKMNWKIFGAKYTKLRFMKPFSKLDIAIYRN